MLMEVGGKPLIERVIENCLHVKNAVIIVATTQQKSDDELVQRLEQLPVFIYRGEENDVLKRYYDAASFFNLDLIFRVTGDDPFKLKEHFEVLLDTMLEQNLDYVCNNEPPSYPEGFDLELFRFNSLEEAHKKASNTFDREHVTPYLRRTIVDDKKFNLKSEIDYSKIRLTVDYLEDLKIINQILNENIHFTELLKTEWYINYLRSIQRSSYYEN